MMHRCSNMVGPCTCGLFHSQATSFSMLFSMPNNHYSDDHHQADHHMYNQYASSSSSTSSVDCTLSLGTPSTRGDDDDRRSRHERRSSGSCMSNFRWDVLQPKSSPSAGQSQKSGRGGNGSDPLLARRCANCDTTSTPLWRNGPRGPKSLCNACGIRFKKEERRASAAAATGGGSGGMMEQQFNNIPWAQQSQKMPCYSPAGNEFRFIEDVDNRDSFLSWRLNVTDRPGLVHDFTR